MKLFCKFLLPALLLFANNVFAQKNFREGYIINLQGDTIRGNIDYQEWEQNPLSITFRDASGKTSNQIPANTKAFYLKDAGLYEAYTVRLSHDVVSVSNPVNFLDSAKTPKSVFLKKMISGKILDLYYYVDKIKTHYITLEKRNGRPLELTYHYYFFNAVANEYNGFRNELLDYAQNYHVLTDQLLARIENAKYDEASIVSLINAINGENATVAPKIKTKIKEQAVNKEEPKDISAHPSFIRIFAGAALNITQLTYTGFVDLAENPKSHTNFLPQINAGLDFSNNPDISRLIVRLELSGYGGSLMAESANAKKTVDVVTLCFKPQLIYNFYIKDPIKIFASSGFTYSLSSYSNKTYTVTNNRYNIIAGEQDLTDKLLFIPVKAGVVLNRRIELYANYNFPVEIEGNGALNYIGTFNSFSAGVNYFFGRK